MKQQINFLQKEQEVYDFSAVTGAIKAVGPNQQLLTHVRNWARMLVAYQDDPDNFILTQNNILGKVVERIIALVGSMDRPIMLERFQEYARPVLTDADYTKYVRIPQIIYDFDQLDQLAEMTEGQDDLVEEVITLRDHVIQGNGVGIGNISNAFINLIVGTRARPRLETRLFLYLNILYEFPDDDGPDDDLLDDSEG